MTSRDYNALISLAAQNQPLRGTRTEGGAPGPHHWRVTAQPFARTKKNEWGINPLDGTQYFSDAIFSQSGAVQSPVWRVNIGPGMINDRMAAITYKVAGDPRGWVPPPDYPLEAGASQVDRKLNERIDPPFLVAVAPSADGKDPGDFRQMSDADRATYLSFFRTREMWERELWRAVVFVTAEPLTQGIAWDRLGFPFPVRNGRFRVMLRPEMPQTPSGTQLGGTVQLAQLHLVRVPGKPEQDRIYVRQLCFWSLWTANADMNPFGEFNPFNPSPPGFGGIGAGVVDALALAAFEFADFITGGALQEIADLYASASSVEFWTV